MVTQPDDIPVAAEGDTPPAPAQPEGGTEAQAPAPASATSSPLFPSLPPSSQTETPPPAPPPQAPPPPPPTTPDPPPKVKAKAKAKAKVKAKAKAKAKEEPEEEEDRRSQLPTEEEAFAEGRVWYIIHTYSGHENKVQTNLEHRTASMDAEDLIFRVVVPTEDEIEIREGQRRTVSKKIFPGYILVQMVELNEDDPNSNRAWFVVRNTPGVTGFVGSGTRPVPLEPDEVRRILKQMRVLEPKIKVGFVLGQSVRIVDGPFQDFVGNVDDLNLEKGKVKVLVSFFGRETPVELDFLQVEKL